MAEIRVREPARRRGWVWLVPVLLLLAIGAWFLLERGPAQPESAGVADTTTAVSGGAIDTAPSGVYAPQGTAPATDTVGATPAPPQPRD